MQLHFVCPPYLEGKRAPTDVMPGKHLTLNGLEAATPILSRRAGDAAPCQLLGVIRRKPSTKLLDRLVDEIDSGKLSGLAIFDVPDVSFLNRFPTLRHLELRPTAKLDIPDSHSSRS